MQSLALIARLGGFGGYILLSLFQTPTLEGAHFVTSDIASTNGVIHVIDKVCNVLIRICSSAPQAVQNY